MTKVSQEMAGEASALHHDASDVLWRVITRYDAYANGTNTKTALATAFNAFVLGGVTLQSVEIASSFGPSLSRAVAVLLLVATLMAIASLGFAFKVVMPYVGSPRSPTRYHSLVFFGHVAEHATGEEYLLALQASTPRDLERDLGLQAHALAVGLTAKFKHAGYSIGFILYGVLPALAAVGFLKLIDILLLLPIG